MSLWIIFCAGLFGLLAVDAKTTASKSKETHQETLVAEEKFDQLEYGRIEKNEIEVNLKVVQKDSDILVALDFENISKRELHIYSGLWFTQLEVTVNDQLVRYVGPVASLPAPQKSDYKTLRPGDRLSTKSVLLNSYYSLPRLPGGSCVIKFRFEKYTTAAEARFTLK